MWGGESMESTTASARSICTGVGQLVWAMKQVAEGSNDVKCILSVEVRPEIKTTDSATQAERLNS